MIKKDVTLSPDNVYGFKNKKEFPRVGWDNSSNPKRPIYRLIMGLCPCAVCGHLNMKDCHAKDCNCCSETCT